MRPVLLTGTATDDTAVTAVRVAIRDRVSKLWLQADKVTWDPNYTEPRTVAQVNRLAMVATFRV